MLQVGVRFSCPPEVSAPSAPGAGPVVVTHMASGVVIAKGAAHMEGRCVVHGAL